MAPPLCKLGIRFDCTKGILRAFLPGFELGLKAKEDLFFCSSPDFGRKMGRNLSEELFFLFFSSSTDFGWKKGRNLSEDLFFYFLALQLILGGK